MKKVAVVQSNYIPWKGYFDLIAAVDEFILYDEVQFTKNDWRNRNKIKTPKGLEWLSIPVGQDIRRRIRDVELPDRRWQEKHWKTLEANYGRAAHFAEVARVFEPLYLQRSHAHLSALNREFIEAICRYLGIATKISNCWDYDLVEGKTDRLVSLAEQAGASEYVSGPSAKSYIDERAFASHGIELTWFDYAGYPAYPQLWGDFSHEVTILDLLFNCGRDAPRYMRFVSRERATMANRTAMSDPTPSQHLYNMSTRGYSVVPAMLEPSDCDRLKAALSRALAEYRPGPTEQSRNDRYLMHDLLCRDPIFGHLLEDPRLQELIAPLLGPSWIMYAFTSSSLPPHGTNYGNRIHVDSPRWVQGYAFNVGVMWALDEFTDDNGATQVLPGSHHSAATPSPEFFDRHFLRLTCAAGSMILFDGRVFHRAGDNRTGAWRHALTLNACRSFMKQRFDWVRFVPTPIADALNPQARRIIGFDTRLPASLEEFFLPEEHRLYKPGQG